MKKQTKISLIIATCLVLVGAIMFSSVMTINKWDFKKLRTKKFETNTHFVSGESFTDISIHTSEAKVNFLPSDNDKCKIVCYEVEKLLHTVEVADGVLTIMRYDTREFTDYLMFGGGSPEITIYLPKREYGTLLIRKTTGSTTIPKDFWFENIDINHSTGDIICNASATKNINIRSTSGYITLESVYAKSLKLSVSTGRITATSVTCQGDVDIEVSTGKAVVSDLSCQNFDSDGNTGDITLTNVIATKAMSIERSTGDIVLDNCDAAELEIETDTGDVTGTLLTDKVFLVETDTGDIDVPKSQFGGKCEISTDTGDVKINIKE